MDGKDLAFDIIDMLDDLGMYTPSTSLTSYAEMLEKDYPGVAKLLRAAVKRLQEFGA